jgi:hypothetical protein
MSTTQRYRLELKGEPPEIILGDVGFTHEGVLIMDPEGNTRFHRKDDVHSLSIIDATSREALRHTACIWEARAMGHQLQEQEAVAISIRQCVDEIKSIIKSMPQTNIAWRPLRHDNRPDDDKEVLFHSAEEDFIGYIDGDDIFGTDGSYHPKALQPPHKITHWADLTPPAAF